MTVKTIHILDKTAVVPATPGHDRLSEEYPPLLAIMTELIESGEIPRYRDIESQIVITKDNTTITTVFATRAGAEKWVDWVRNDNYALISIDVVED